MMTAFSPLLYFLSTAIQDYSFVMKYILRTTLTVESVPLKVPCHSGINRHYTYQVNIPQLSLFRLKANPP